MKGFLEKAFNHLYFQAIACRCIKHHLNWTSTRHIFNLYTLIYKVSHLRILWNIYLHLYANNCHNTLTALQSSVSESVTHSFVQSVIQLVVYIFCSTIWLLQLTVRVISYHLFHYPCWKSLGFCYLVFLMTIHSYWRNIVTFAL